ncbi:MAG: hypothetical protein ACRCST_17245, partial [Turicibacter sp.]
LTFISIILMSGCSAEPKDIIIHDIELQATQTTDWTILDEGPDEYILVNSQTKEKAGNVILYIEDKPVQLSATDAVKFLNNDPTFSLSTYSE